MELLKKIFPFSFTKKDGIAALIINILIYLVVGIVVGFLIGILAKIPVVGLIIGLVGGLADLYITAGIVMSILDYCKVFK
jgi:uncharacterized membrane protein AbrB (regulator of aidB expression)